MTTTRPLEGAPASFPDRVSQWFGQGAQIVTGIAGLSYAFGWLLTARFYGSFGVEPEEAGVSFSWLAIRAFLVGLTGLAIFLVARALLQAAERSQPVVHIVHSRAAIIVLTAVSCIGVSSLVAFLLAAWVESKGGRVGAPPIIAILACGVTISLIILWLRPPTVQLGWDGRLWLRGFAGALLGFVAASLILTPYRLADYLAADVREGRAVHLMMLPGIPGLQATPVRLMTLSGDAAPGLPDNARCVLRLGGNGSTSIYFGSGRILRINDQNVTATAPC